jgi:transposase
MCLHAEAEHAIPEETVRAAKSAFKKGNVYMRLRDRLDGIYDDADFAALYPSARGRPAEGPARLALCLIIQYMEGLSDRQMADAVRARIDVKYLLGLEMGDPGFDHTVLGDFATRLIEGGAEAALLDKFLEVAQSEKLLKAGGRQRTDATHVLAAVRRLNRLECVGETLRNALEAVAEVAPEWLQALAAPEWYQRYARRVDQYRLPKTEATRREQAETIGRDGMQLLTACYAGDAPPGVRELVAVEILRAVWVQQYTVEDEQVRWRGAKECPPATLTIESPYDVEAHYSTKKTINTDWVGYKVHVTESCEDDQPHLITNVETTLSTVPDVEVTPIIHAHLAEKGLLPAEHWVDGGYVDAGQLVQSQARGVDLVGPAQPDSSWQARAADGYDVSCFAIDWEAQQVTCPQGQVSITWSASRYRGQASVEVRFAEATCRACPERARCTRCAKQGRSLRLLPHEQHLARQARRLEQRTEAFKVRYRRRAGVEGTISQGVRRCGLRRTRYIGLIRTHLEHILTALAINVVRLSAWWGGDPRAKTRYSHFAALALAPI